MNKGKTDSDKIYQSAMIIIGNEVLSGRTQDANLSFLASELHKQGIRMTEVRIVPDIEKTIVDTVNELRAKYDYVFTTGGIGPTHDDITAASVANAFGVRLERNIDAVKSLENYYLSKTTTHINDERLKMADIPAGAELIDNPVSGAPGFRIENVFVMAGVPKIMQGMVKSFVHRLAGGKPVRSMTVEGHVTESSIAKALTEMQVRHPDVEIGSYPAFKGGKGSVSVVLSGVDVDELKLLADEVFILMQELNGNPQIRQSKNKKKAMSNQLG